MPNTCRINHRHRLFCRSKFASSSLLCPIFLILFASSTFCLLDASALLPKESPQKQIVGMITTMRDGGGVQEEAGENDGQNDGEMGESRKCEIKVHIVKQVKGECVRLFGGKPACQSAEYVDPENEQCRDEESSIYL